METSSKKNEFLLPVSILIAAIMISGSIFYVVGSRKSPDQNQNSGSETASVSSLNLNIAEDEVILGDPKAPVTLIEYADFQCPFCAKLHSETIPLLVKEYVNTSKVKMIYRHFPFLGPESPAAAEAVECAKDQGKFWSYEGAIYDTEIQDQIAHPGAFENNGNLTKELFVKFAGDFKMDTAAFIDCFDSKKYAAKVEKDYKDASASGKVKSTPTVFINNQMIEGAYPYATFKQVIDAELSKISPSADSKQ